MRSSPGKVIVERNFNLSAISKIPTSGCAAYYLKPFSVEGVRDAINFVEDSGLPFFIAGAGFNTLWGEGYYPGAVIDFTSLKGIQIEGSSLCILSGTLLSEVIRVCVSHGLSGLENLAGIPASIGGAVVSNAGAFGRSMGEVVGWVEVFVDGKLVRLGKDSLCFDYRFSNIKGLPVVKVWLELTESSPQQVKDQVHCILLKRKDKFPQGRSLGCIFKNRLDLTAGRLLDEMGFKGYRYKKAVVSDKHANFILAEKGCRAKDFYRLICLIKERVFKERGIILEEEIVYAGSFV